VPWAWLAVLAAIPVGILVLERGSRWMVGHYYWVDLAIAPAMTLLLLAVVSGRPAALVRLLSSRPLERLGSFSYSLYLIHLPIVVAISFKLVAPRLGHGTAAFLVTTVAAGGLSLVGAWLFAKAFEFPFQRHRSWAELMGRRAGQQEQTVLDGSAAADPPPTSTAVPPTSTAVPPTSTAVPPTSTAVPPTSTATSRSLVELPK